MTHLVYHDLASVPGQFSPFDEAVLRVCRSGTVGIVSPYIGVDYLQRIIGVSEKWRLISDIEAWLTSLSIRARPKAWQFIRENLDRIHHCSAIHAKAVIGQQVAMLGSANLTIAGILGRTEMGILIDDLGMVAELSVWFDTLWQQTHPPIADETNTFIRWLDDDAKRSSTRREKFSLSASGTKIRARLAKLSMPTTDESRGVTINLEEIAQGLIVQEEKHYNSLNEALESAIDALADDGFVFGQIVEHIRQAFPESTIRETYFALLQHCANHVRSVFSENTRNRLILADGLFKQSTKELIPQSLAPFDFFLVHLVHHFDFNQARDLPDEDDLENATGVRGQDQTVLISELLDCGFLEIDDIAGHLPQYNLSEAFEWNGRYKLFIRAMHDWIVKNNRAIQQTERSKRNNSNDVISDDFSMAEVPDVVVSDESAIEPFLSMEKISLSEFLRSESEKIEISERARKEQLAVNRQNRHDGIDKILAHLLLALLSGKKLPPAKEILVEIPDELTVERKWVQQVLRGEESDIPKVILTTKNAVSINPSLDWEDLADYPLTQGICKKFLEI